MKNNYLVNVQIIVQASSEELAEAVVGMVFDDHIPSGAKFIDWQLTPTEHTVQTTEKSLKYKNPRSYP